jgi:hypothetical protein
VARLPTLTSALRHALKSVEVAPADAAAVRLAYGYAQLLDRGAIAAQYVKPLREVRSALAHADDAAAALEHLAKLEIALSAHTTASDLGPKLLAVLESLAMTPRARVAVIGKGAPTREPAASPLDELRRRRRARADRATPVDTTATPA